MLKCMQAQVQSYSVSLLGRAHAQGMIKDVHPAGSSGALQKLLYFGIIPGSNLQGSSFDQSIDATIASLTLDNINVKQDRPVYKQDTRQDPCLHPAHSASQCPKERVASPAGSHCVGE